jgi:hypothetical protein
MDRDPRYRGTQAALDFVVLYHRLMARRRGRPISNIRGGHNKKLSALQDYALKDYIFMLYRANININITEIQRAISRLLYYVIGDRKSIVSRWWTKAWLIYN